MYGVQTASFIRRVVSGARIVHRYDRNQAVVAGKIENKTTNIPRNIRFTNEKQDICILRIYAFYTLIEY